MFDGSKKGFHTFYNVKLGLEFLAREFLQWGKSNVKRCPNIHFSFTRCPLRTPGSLKLCLKTVQYSSGAR